MGYFKQLDILNQERNKTMGQNAGIDYGRGMSNIDHETGIRYGVINQREVLQAWADSSEGQYGLPTCPKCGDELTVEQVEVLNDIGHCEHGKCGAIYDGDQYGDDPIEFTYENDGYICQQSGDDPDIFILKSPYFTYCQFCSPCAPGAGYLMNYFDNGYEERGLIKFMLSANPEQAKQYKENAENAGFIKAYCFGHDWFDNETICEKCHGTGNIGLETYQECPPCKGAGQIDHGAPYPVFSVSTGELISCD